ncbi:hypothetical protein E2R68_13505 [Psychromonas sp. RZ22]|uniref:hypothetical protein n=1 Tax=Psychromonas algarum TaxID=2555643 RepID=UPI001067E2A7|nr:hypothetical protein [Psychromonas sp. RZ22]TEW53167.1 hypothetical protein E2R68_13505 [Psychromonas sp. RZ22]
MRGKLIKDFLLYIEDCHKALADLYQRLSLEAGDEKAKLLLEYMKNKEQISYLHLHQLAQQAPISLLNTWLNDFSDHSFPLRCKTFKLKPKLTIENVVTLAIQFDMQLIEIMQTASPKNTTTEVETTIENLISREEEMLHQVVMVSHEFEHM